MHGEGFDGRHDDVRKLQDGQVDELITESPYLEEHRDALVELRSTAGWHDSESTPLIAPEGKILIKINDFNSSLGWNTDFYKEVDASLKESFEALQKVNQLPGYRKFSILEIAPVSGEEVTSRILKKLSESISKDAKGFENMTADEQRAILEKWKFFD